MATLIITILGDNRTGLVEAVSGAIAAHGGSWERSHVAELSGKFAGVVEASVADDAADALIDQLDQIHTEGLLHITAERAAASVAAADVLYVELELTGQDHPGIVHQVSAALSEHGVSIDELVTEISPAPQGGDLFHARAHLEVPHGVVVDDLRQRLEAITNDLMVDLEVVPTDC